MTYFAKITVSDTDVTKLDSLGFNTRKNNYFIMGYKGNKKTSINSATNYFKNAARGWGFKKVNVEIVKVTDDEQIKLLDVYNAIA